MNTYANDIVIEHYRKYLNRSPEPAGFTYWVEQVIEMLDTGRAKNEVEDVLKTEFTNSVEYKAINAV